MAESDQDGQALYNLHQSRVAWHRSNEQASGAMPQVDGGL